MSARTSTVRDGTISDAIRCVNRAGLVVASVFVLGSSPAHAHPEWSPIRVNRYTKVVLQDPGALRIVYTLLYGDGPALPARKAVDVDANGRIDERERAQLGTRAETQVKAGLRLELDGRPLVLPAPTVDVGLAGDAVAPEAFSVDLAYVVDTPPGLPHTLTIDDRVEVPNEGDTEVAVDNPAAAHVLEMHRGRPSGKAVAEPVFTFRGPRFSALEDRTVTVRWQTPVAPSRRGSFLIAGIAAMALAAIVWAARAARRQRSM